MENFQNHAKRETDLATLCKVNLRQFIRHLREERGLKEITIKRRITCLKLLSRWTKQEGVIGINHFDNLHERIIDDLVLADSSLKTHGKENRQRKVTF